MPHGRSLQQLRDSGKYEHLEAVEWELLEICLNPDLGSRLPIQLLPASTKYFLKKPPAGMTPLTLQP